MYKLKWTRLQFEMFRLFCIKSGISLNVREIARELSVTPTAVSKALPILVKEKLLILKKYGKINLNLVHFNRGNQKAIYLKRTENLRLIYESGIVDFFHNEFPGCTIVLFGSYSKGEDVYTEKKENRSDIDIAVIGIKEKNIEIRKFEKLLEREIILNFYESWEVIHKYLKDSILNGIILVGGVDL